MHATGPVAQLIRQRFQLACRRLGFPAEPAEFHCRRISFARHYVLTLSCRSIWSAEVRATEASHWEPRSGTRGHKVTMLRRGILAAPIDIPHHGSGSWSMKAICMTSACLGVVLLGGCMQARIEESREMRHPPRQGRTRRHPRQAADRRRGRRRRLHGLHRRQPRRRQGRPARFTTTTISSTRCFPGSSRARRPANPKP